MAAGLITDALAPLNYSWGMDAPYSIFSDGRDKLRIERWGFTTVEGMESLPDSVEWTLGKVALGWTQERADRWWKVRIEGKRLGKISKKEDRVDDRHDEDDTPDIYATQVVCEDATETPLQARL